ncbi:MAG: glycosyltransferase [Sphingobacteriaceae bacterium]|nr:glycosyltransferase [Sphingobacteriaceae bacterium]
MSQIIYSNKKGDCEDIYVSYWFNQWSTALSVLVCQSKITKYFSRVHGADLYEERVPVIKKLPYRKFQLKKISKLFSVSNKGADYLKNRYPLYKNKIFTARLGTHDAGVNPFKVDAVFTILSCATIRNIKRIDLIIKILEHIEFPIRWIHIGAESVNDPTIPNFKKCLSNLKNNKPNIELRFVGALKNEDVFDLYRNESIHLFVSVSETEGLPVSMMEAISFGIPVMATNVGGCNEIVNESTGFLIEKDFDPKIVAQKIGSFKDSAMNSNMARKDVRRFWKERFEVNKNFKIFLERIIN